MSNLNDYKKIILQLILNDFEYILWMLRRT